MIAVSTQLFFILYEFLEKFPKMEGIVYFSAEYLPIVVTCLVITFVFTQMNFKIAMRAIIFSVGVPFLFTYILKYFLDSPRPFMRFSEVSPLFFHGGLDSFPSGHATFFSSLFVTILLMKFPRSIVITVGVSAVIIGIARIIAGVHFPIDILAGFIVGGIGSYCMSRVMNIHKYFIVWK